MKVMHLISGGDTGGAKTHVLSLVESLLRGADVQLVCLTPGAFYNEAVDRRLPVVLLEQRSRADLSSVRGLTDLVEETSPDLIHCHGARANFLAALAKRRVGVPIITTIHSDYRRDFEGNLYKHLVYSTLNSLSLRYFDHYLAVTDDFRCMLIDRGFPGGKIHTVYNGLDFDAELPSEESAMAFRSRLGIPPDALLIGMVSRLAPVKRHDVFLRAASILLREGHDAHFVLVGEGEERQRLQRLTGELALGHRVHFLGHLPSTQDAMAAIDINILPSESESFPYALLEGALHGKATVATPVGGIPELIRDGRTGRLVRVGDPADLAEKLGPLITSRATRENLGRALRAHAGERFSLEAMRETHMSIYSRVVEAGKHPPRVTVSGYFGFGNLGDEALLRGLIKGLERERPGVDTWVLSADPKATARAHQISSAPRFSPLKVLSCLRRSDLFISGGGTLLQDETSLRSLVYYTSLIYLARILGAPVMIYANGIGPLRTGLGRRLARSAIRSAAAVTLRDRASAGTVRAIMGETGDWIVTADPAFALDLPPTEEVDSVLDEVMNGDAWRGSLVVLSMRPWAQDTDGPASLAARAADTLSDAGYSPLLLAMQESKDLPLAEMASRMSESHPPVLSTKGMQPELVLGIMGQSKLVLGMRLHALILAAAAGTIPVGLSYDPKIDGFLSDLGAPCLGRIENLTPHDLEFVLRTSILPNLATLTERVQDGAKRMKEEEEGNARRAATLLQRSSRIR